MTLDGETASRIAREVVGGGKATRVYPHSTDVALVRAGWDARDAEVEELLAQLAKVRERVERRHCADDPLCGHDDQVWADHFSEVVADVLAILDESPTEREAPADREDVARVLRDADRPDVPAHLPPSRNYADMAKVLMERFTITHGGGSR